LDKPKKLNLPQVISIITIISLFSKLLGMLREVGIAKEFGVGSSTDAFYVALVIPTLIFTSVGVALQNLFMAEFSTYKEHYPDLKSQYTFINKMVNIILIISISLFLLSFIFTKGIVRVVAPGFTEPNKFSLTVTLTKILLPTMVIIPVYQIKASVLRVYDKYISVQVIDLFFNISQLIYLYLFADRFGIEGLTITILLAYLLQLLVVDLILISKGYRYHFILDFKDQYLKNIFILFLPTLISFGIIQVNELVNKIIASNLADGSVAALNYGLMVRNLVYNIITLSILTVIYPKMLGYKSKGEDDTFIQLIGRTTNILTLILLPISVIMLGFSEPIIKIIFERGEFTPNDTLITGKVLYFYTFGIVAFSLKDYFVRVSYAYKNTKLPLYITIIGSLMNIILSIILKHYMGVYGIALSLSLSEIISLIIFIIFIIKYRYIKFNRYFSDVIKIIVVNAVLYILLISIKRYLILPDKTILLIIYLALYVFVFGLLYLMILLLLKVHPFSQFIYQFLKRGKNYEGDNK